MIAHLVKCKFLWLNLKFVFCTHHFQQLKSVLYGVFCWFFYLCASNIGACNIFFFYVKLVYWNLMVRMNLAIRWVFEPFIFAYAGVRTRSTISITNLHTKFISRDVSAFLLIIAILRVLNLNICDVFFVLIEVPKFFMQWCLRFFY